MKAPESSVIADSPLAPAPVVDPQITALRQLGADRFDPVRFHYLEALAQRAAAHQGRVKRILDTRLASAMAALQQDFEQRILQAKKAIDELSPAHPDAATALKLQLASGDIAGVMRSVAIQARPAQAASLRDLVRELAQQPSENADAGLNAYLPWRPELKTVRHFRNTWSKLSVDRQVTKALGQAPKNAGPVNSHMLVLRSLAMMREISPDYLNRFMTYADTLLCLEQGDKAQQASTKKTADAEKSTKIKTRRKPTPSLVRP